MLAKSFKRFVIAPLLLTLASCATAPEDKVSLLDQVQSRGELRCGISGTLPGFSYLDDGSYTGLDVDICRAVAAATVGDADKVDYPS